MHTGYSPIIAALQYTEVLHASLHYLLAPWQVLSSVEASFLPDDEKAELLVKVKEDIAEWESGTQWVELET